MQAMALLRRLVRATMLLLSHAGDGATEMTLAMAQYLYRVMLVMTLLSHADDVVTEEAWPQHDVDAELCWQQSCRAMLATMLPGRLGHDTMKMMSHTGDGAAESCW
jgi:hypothetical protein